MKVDFVADVGNSRIKWGRCLDDQVAEAVSLSPDDPQDWQNQREAWRLAGAASWAVAGVHPQRRDRLAAWVRQLSDRVRVIDDCQQLPLHVQLDHPERVGIDRLLNAVAASRLVPRGMATVLIDAGSAITVDWLDETGAFAGGAIFPGLRLMARALHDYTALLPLVELHYPPPPLPGTSTTTAMEAGVFWAAAGGIQFLVNRLITQATAAVRVIMTGGDGPFLAKALNHEIELWPNMTLEGIRIAAETMP
jgi:type III pantothenate kinase